MGNFTYVEGGAKQEVRLLDHSPVDDYPNIGGLRVWIEGNCFRMGAIEMMAKAGCVAAKTVDEADLVVFLGGEDVSPELYGEQPHRTSYWNRDRDAREKKVYDRCIELEIPMMGICRGIQLIHVLAGGKLYQNVSNHGRSHFIVDEETGAVIRSSSMHHQMVIENEDMFVLAYAQMDDRRKYETFNTTLETNRHDDVEAAIYMNQRAICFQGHPELGDLPEYTKWCLNKLKDFLYELDIIGGIHEGNFKRADGSILPRNTNVQITKEEVNE